MTRIKLCGLQRPEEIRAVNALRPDYIGFVFAPKSRRCISREQAAELKRMLHPDIRAVGVFTDADPERIAEDFGKGLIDLAQLHGAESEEEIRFLQKACGVPVIRAFQIRSEEDLKGAEESPADFILLDSGAGSGETFDWSVLKGIRRPFFLAGGLVPLNVQQAIRQVQPFAVDVSSGIETGGQKDVEKMKAFVKAVRERTENK